jgi:signal transduction histidine kinase/ligand-binding sensor domain-containing protein/CheY-like chemotaxis protein
MVTVERVDVSTSTLPFDLNALPTTSLKPARAIASPEVEVDLGAPLALPQAQVHEQGAALERRSVVASRHVHRRVVTLRSLPREVVKPPSVRERNPDCFSCFSKNQGLPHDAAHAMLEDREGRIWFATGAGLACYDGHAYTRIGEAEGMPSASVWSLLQDRNGHIWFGSSDGTVGRIDGLTLTLYTDSLLPARQGVTSLAEDGTGRIWVGREADGLALWHGDSITVWTHPDRPGANEVLSLHAHRDGSLWIGTRGHGAARFNGTTFTWHHLPNDTVRQVFSDTDGALWFCTNGGVVQSRDGHFAAYERQQGLPPDAIRRGLAGADGTTWFATQHDGVFSIHLWRLRHLTEASGLPTNEIRSLLLTRRGTLWVGTSGDGACRYDGHRFRHWSRGSEVPGTAVKSILADAGPSVWLGSYDAGLLRMNDTGLQHFAPGDGLPASPIVGLARDQAGRLWCAFNGAGAAMIDGPTLRTMGERQGLGTDQLEHLAVDAQGTVWLATRSGVVRIVNDTMQTLSFGGSAAGATPRFIHAAASGRVWISLRDVGAVCLDGGTWRHYRPGTALPDGRVTCMLEDEQGRAWLGTHRGIAVIHGDTVTHLSQADGLCSDQVSSLVVEAGGGIVYGTRHGMGRIRTSGDPGGGQHRWRIENFGFREGFLGGGVNDGQTMARGADGRIWIATNSDLTVYRPESDLQEAPPQLQLYGLSLFNEALEWVRMDSTGQAREVLANGLQVRDLRHHGITPWSLLPRAPALRHDNNYLTFHFTGIDTERPTGIRYRWRLEGLEEGWSAPSPANSAQYGNLRPGAYTFHAQAMNSSGVWSIPVSYPFTIRPHWSATWWAFTGYALVALSLVLGFVRWRTAALKARQVELVREVEIATRDLRLQKERAEESERHKQQFLANMSHEIRTPMNAIMGMAGILKRNPHSPEQQSYLNAIATSSENLLVILNDILDVSRLEAGRIGFERIPFAPRAVMGNVRDIIRFRAEEKRLALDLELDPALPDLLLGDPTRLNQIVLNLAGNAVKFTEQGSITIRVAWRPPMAHPLEPGELVVEVSDTGIGIPPDRLDRIFEEFTQAYSDTTRKYGGTGLGLTISRRLAELQGGRIAVRSELGQGSVFTMSIPYDILEQDPATPTRPEAGMAERRNTFPSGLRDLRILLAEDNAFNAMVAQDELAYAIPGVQVAVATNGRIAVEMALTGDHDLILMDVQMPEMNGYDAARAIRALKAPRPNTPIVAMTANVMKEEVERCIQAGMNGYIPKPFTREELMNGILSAMNVRTT